MDNNQKLTTRFYSAIKQCFTCTGELRQATSAKMNVVSSYRTANSGLYYTLVQCKQTVRPPSLYYIAVLHANLCPQANGVRVLDRNSLVFYSCDLQKTIFRTLCTTPPHRLSRSKDRLHPYVTERSRADEFEDQRPIDGPTLERIHAIVLYVFMCACHEISRAHCGHTVGRTAFVLG